MTYNEYGSLVYMKAAAWVLGVVMSCLIVASRKHYTVDVVIAWYTVPLVFYTLYRRWTTRRPINDFNMLNDSSNANTQLEMSLVEVCYTPPSLTLHFLAVSMSMCITCCRREHG